MEIITNNAKETFDFGEKIGSSLKGGEIIALYGEMGAGKTTFVQGLASGMGITNNVTSPTFLLMKQYSKDANKTLFHLDLYRLEENINDELENLGVYDLWGDPKNVFVIEWSEKIKEFPNNTITIHITPLGEDKRKISYEGIL